jgi:hypothetical protein
MTDRLVLAAAVGSDTDLFDLDLRDEDELLAADRVEYDIDGVRALLAAINLQPVGAPSSERGDGEIVDLAVFRATGSRSLARIFGSTR